MSGTLVAVVFVALAFDFTNGFHDTANAIATSVSTHALSPRVAVLFAGLLNFAGAFVSLKVAATVGKGIVSPEAVPVDVVLAGLVAAICWNLLTWLLGLPTSSSHALIGGVMGSASAAAGWHVVNWSGLYQKVLLPSLAAPFLGIALAGLIALAIVWLLRNLRPGPVNAVFRRLQIVSAGFVAFTHGTNDAQKTMGVIALALETTRHRGRPYPVRACPSGATSNCVIRILGTHRLPSQCVWVLPVWLVSASALLGLPRARGAGPTQLFVGPKAPSGKKTIVLPRPSLPRERPLHPIRISFLLTNSSAP